MFVFVGAGQLWGAEVAVEGVWKSNLELGYVQTGGNTQVRSLNTKGKMINDGKSFRTTAEGTALNTTDKSVTTAERYSASLQEDWKFTEYDYAFIRAGFDTDRFGGFKRRISETLGYGRTLLKQDGLDWNIELGSGARQTTLTSNKKTNELIGRVASNLKWKINDNASFIQEFKAEGGKEGVVSNSLTALQNKISGHLSSKISYAIQHTSKVPVGTKKDNTEFSVALVWSY
jgi:putative salt-induced outer membrane protein